LSTTGNLLFPESDDNGWISSIQKALPEPEPDKTPDFETIEDPVAIEAEARFAELAAKTAEHEAISAAGWSAEAIPQNTPPATAQDGLSAAALNALDAVIDREALKDPGLAAVDDPVALEAASAFAQAAAEAATRDAVQNAGWTAEVRRVAEPSPVLAEEQQPDTPDVESEFSPEALAALDSVLARGDVQTGLAAVATDPVALEADAAFYEVAADVVTEHAIFAAGWSAMARKPGDGVGVAMLTPGERLALDAALAEEAKNPGYLTQTDDPVGLASDAVFSEIAADVAVRDAIQLAEWTPQPTPGKSALEIAEVVPPEVLDALSPLSPSEQRALDAVQAEQFAAESGPASGADPVALEADSLFTDMAADLVIEDALRIARREARPDPSMVVQTDTRQQPIGPGFWEVEDLVRAEAEIAFDDVAFDLAYNTVDSLVTGEAAALTAFDQAIASGADPQEALALAIAAAEQVDPRTFGPTQVAAIAIGPNDGPVAALPKGEAAPEEDKTGNTAGLSGTKDTAEASPEDNGPEEPITFARVGEGFDTLPNEDLLYGGPDGDTLGGAARDFEFTLDLDQVSGAGSHFKKTERDDVDVTATTTAESNIDGTAGADTLIGTTASDNIFGYAGDDILIGGQGADTVTGGTGADQFVFEGGAGADVLAHAASLGTDIITDYSAIDGDTFGLSDADFGFGAAGTLTGGTDYFESATTLTGAAQDVSGGAGGAAIVVLGAGSGTGGVDIYYTADASAMTTENSYQIADVTGTNTGDLSAGDFNLRA